MSSGAQSAVVCSTAGSAVRSAQPPLALPCLSQRPRFAVVARRHGGRPGAPGRRACGPAIIYSLPSLLLALPPPSVTITFKDDKDGSTKTVQAPLGKSILEVAHENDVELEGAHRSAAQHSAWPRGLCLRACVAATRAALEPGPCKRLACALCALQGRARGRWRAPPAT